MLFVQVIKFVIKVCELFVETRLWT